MSEVVVRRALSVGLAASLYGLSLGALGVAAGLTVAQTCAMSLLLFTGGSQFALVGIIGGGGSAASAITASSLLGIRNGLYGLQLKPILGVRGLRRVAAAQLTIDESTAVVRRVAGDALGDPKQYGLDAAAAGAFLGLLWPRLSTREPVAVAAAVVAVVAGLARR